MTLARTRTVTKVGFYQHWPFQRCSLSEGTPSDCRRASVVARCCLVAISAGKLEWCWRKRRKSGAVFQVDGTYPGERSRTMT